MEIIKGKVDWINIVNPTAADMEWLRKKFKFHKVILKELQEPSARARVEGYDGYIYFIYYFPIYDSKEQTSRRCEIDFVVTKNAVVTVHYEDIGLLDHFRGLSFENTLDLTYQILQTLLNFEERQVRHIQQKVEEIGKALFQNREKDVLKTISYLKRDVAQYRIIIRHQRPILESLLGHGVHFWGEQSRIYLNDTVGEYLKIMNQIEDYREALFDYEQTNNQLMNVKTNEVMKTFTVLAFLTFPLMLVASIFTMRTPGIPFVDRANGFWIVLGIMSTLMALMLVYFKNKDWL